MKKLKTLCVAMLTAASLSAQTGTEQPFKTWAQTPPMGWNSWNTFGANISEALIRETADAMVETGLRDAGYEYLVIDDCWSLRERDENGSLVADPKKFPDAVAVAAVARICRQKYRTALTDRWLPVRAASRFT